MQGRGAELGCRAGQGGHLYGHLAGVEKGDDSEEILSARVRQQQLQGGLLSLGDTVKLWH